ncbi:hypothetical protein F5I97DRAFT_1457446 [Phlebopus sp. FC_14]|nr:hypothetical protein F5I97DRAFT_1457446 [Phlebopus sp. FC_14]
MCGVWSRWREGLLLLFSETTFADAAEDGFSPCLSGPPTRQSRDLRGFFETAIRMARGSHSSSLAEAGGCLGRRRKRKADRLMGEGISGEETKEETKDAGGGGIKASDSPRAAGEKQACI